VPGPGYYATQDYSKSNLVKRNNSTFQNFGSGVERFRNLNQEKDVYTAPGMYYQKPDMIIVRKQLY
jgi:hypothetical protein